MKISYLIPGPMGRDKEGQAELQRRRDTLARYAASDTEVGVHDVPTGPASIESVCEEYLSIPAAMRRGVELEQEGWDALILGCYGDPGLDGLRELISIPVVGPGGATALVAASLGHRFSVVTVTESIVASIERQIRNVGVGDKLASVRAVEIPVLRLHEDSYEATAATIEAGRKAMVEDGADTLIVGCMSMGFLGIAEAVAADLGVPVLNPARVALKYAEALVGAGLTHSRQAYHIPPKLASGDVASALDLVDGRR
ncbi:MAG: aspartate/glutamate racemase family protein [Gemmatimonadota bacterium]|nr:MAG: aspartate/glutamate racemase family protein [Gemmatimonadota bacterium]